MGKRSYIYKKVEEGSDQEISDLLEEGRILGVNKYAVVRTAEACLDELTTKGEKEAKQQQPV